MMMVKEKKEYRKTESKEKLSVRKKHLSKVTRLENIEADMVSNEVLQVKDTFLGVKTTPFFFAFWGIGIGLILFYVLSFDFGFDVRIFLFFLVFSYILWCVKFVDANHPLRNWFVWSIGFILTLILWLFIYTLIWKSLDSFYKLFPIFCSESGMSFGIEHHYMCKCSDFASSLIPLLLLFSTIIFVALYKKYSSKITNFRKVIFCFFLSLIAGFILLLFLQYILKIVLEVTLCETGALYEQVVDTFEQK